MNSSKVIADIVWETIEEFILNDDFFLEETLDINESVQKIWGWGIGLDYEKYRMMIGA